jgi:arylsulfatase A-like enzyme
MGDSFRPQKSFSHWFVHPKGGSRYIDTPMIRDGKLGDEPGYLTDVITENALEFLDEHAGDEGSFYLSVCYTAPHSPWVDQHPKEIVDSYDNCAFESCPQEPKHPGDDGINLVYSSSYASEDRRKRGPIPVREHLKGYFASVTAMDLNIGRLLTKLDELGLRENTLIFFTSDNGFNCGHHGIWGKGNSTFPLNLYDTSVKVPAIASHPGNIPEGSVNDALVSGYDVFPTILDYLGLENPEADRLPGRSFVPLLLGKEQEPHRNIVVYDEYGPNRMIRTKEWKYIHRYPYGVHELYDLVHDPNERINLLEDARILSKDPFEWKETARSLKAEMEDWFSRYADPMRDGRNEPVRGRGQIDVVGPAAKGRPTFHGPETPESRITDRVS